MLLSCLVNDLLQALSLWVDGFSKNYLYLFRFWELVPYGHGCVGANYGDGNYGNFKHLAKYGKTLFKGQ
jgi:hypothetical protein